jgi:hypothetical protein
MQRTLCEKVASEGIWFKVVLEAPVHRSWVRTAYLHCLFRADPSRSVAAAAIADAPLRRTSNKLF